MTEPQLRLLALTLAKEIEGPKATVAEVLDAAQAILDFLMGVDAEGARRPN